MGDEQLTLEAQAAMCEALVRPEQEFRNTVKKLVMQVCSMQTNSVVCAVWVQLCTNCIGCLMSVHMWQLRVRFQYPRYVCQQHELFVHLYICMCYRWQHRR